MSAPFSNDLRRLALVAGGAGLVVSAAAALFDLPAALFGWLIAFLFWLGLSVGSMGLLMLQHLSGGRWGLVVRRPLEASSSVTPFLAIAFVPIAIALPALYLWARPEALLDPALLHKRPYLNPAFFIIRAVLCFAAWSALAAWLGSLSRQQDRAWSAHRARLLRRVSAGGLVVYVLTMTFAATDWIMSLEPHWFSTIFGLLLIAGQGVLALSFAILSVKWLSDREEVAPFVDADVFHDYGNLLLAFVMLWAYFAFSQYLIIWSEDLPEEITWYVHRTAAHWQALALLLVVLHFAVPFLILLSRRSKREARRLAVVAAMLVVLRVADLVWLAAPALESSQALLLLSLPSAWVAIGGLWTFVYTARLAASPLVPVRDPDRPRALSRPGFAGHD